MNLFLGVPFAPAHFPALLRSGPPAEGRLSAASPAITHAARFGLSASITHANEGSIKTMCLLSFLLFLLIPLLLPRHVDQRMACRNGSIIIRIAKSSVVAHRAIALRRSIHL